MRKNLIAFLLIISSSVFAQSPLSRVEVVNVDGISKEELYQRLEKWAQDYFLASTDNVSYDSESGKIIAKSRIDYAQVANMGLNQFSCSVAYVLTIEARDGRYRYDLGRFDHSGKYYKDNQDFNLGVLTDQEPEPIGGKKSAAPITKKLYTYAVEQINSKSEEIIASLKEAMATPSSAETDW